LCVLGLGGPVFALIEAPTRGLGDPVVLATLVLGATLLGVFLWWEARIAEPMLPLRLFRLRNFRFANLETFAMYGGLSTLTFFLVLFLQQIAGYSALQSGLALVPVTIVSFVVSPRAGRLAMRFGPRLFMGAGPLLGGFGLLALARLKPGFSYWLELLPPLVVFSLGLSITVAPLTATVLSEAGERDAGVASGVNNAIARVAGLVAIAAVGAAVAGAGNGLDLHGFRLGMIISACLVAVGGVVGFAGIRNAS
jgi:predicted MFS family arabinose efflux permease